MEIYYEVLKAHFTPEALSQLRKHKIILESATQNQAKGRYSIVALDIYGSVTLYDNQLEIESVNQNSVIKDSSYEYLKNYINQFDIEIEDRALTDLPFISGFIGTCSFDLVRHEFPMLKQTPLHDSSQYDVRLFMIEDVYIFDHFKDNLYVIATNQFSKVSKDKLKTRVHQRIEELKNIKPIISPIKLTDYSKNIKTNISDTEFIKLIKELKVKISEGDMFQVVPSRIYSYAHHFDDNLNPLTFQLYQNLKRQNPSPYMYYVNIDTPIIVGSSPESFVKVHNGKVYTNPIAGTIKRGTTFEEDERNANQLLTDEKELSEHRMLVDLGRNDINRISHPGTVKINKLMQIEKYEHVMHIVSDVSGEIKKELSPMSIIASLLPTGTVSGAPKLRAIQRIYENNPQKRGIYSGGIGYINCNQNLDFALVIRTMIIDDAQVNVEAGCGVVYDSIPEQELEETRLKAKSLLEVRP